MSIQRSPAAARCLHIAAEGAHERLRGGRDRHLARAVNNLTGCDLGSVRPRVRRRVGPQHAARQIDSCKQPL